MGPWDVDASGLRWFQARHPTPWNPLVREQLEHHAAGAHEHRGGEHVGVAADDDGRAGGRLEVRLERRRGGQDDLAGLRTG